jgi:hypothetical protein
MSITKGTTVFVYSLDYECLNTFTSFRAAAQEFSCCHKVIAKYAESGKIFQDKYILSLKELPLSSIYFP